MKRNIFEELKEGFHAMEKEREGKVTLRRTLLQGAQSAPADPVDEEYFKKLRDQAGKKKSYAER